MSGPVELERGGDGERINAADVLNGAAILVLAAFVAFFRRQLGEEALWLIGVLASLLLFIALSSWLSHRHVLWRVMHDFSPAVVLPVLFNTLGPIIECASPAQWDPTFAALDERFFPMLAARWRDVLGRPPWLTDLSYLAYVSYYLVPVALGVILYRRETPDAFRRLVFSVVLTFYASYAGYFMFPTLGPRVPFDAEAAIIGGGTFGHGLRLFVDFVERTRTDAFPSGHTAIALLCLYFAWQISQAAFAVFAPIVTAIIFSTVYLHYHYVVDVVAGAALAGGCAWLGPRVQPIFEPREMVRWFAVHLGIR
ncbi:MAG TPA: phosphatase PAP2 family protein [Candidatus Acidoferrales bacterium]|nr:phosphatase PAP2 family protein [Candidatus Acidoferrales bacterium]